MRDLFFTGALSNQTERGLQKAEQSIHNFRFIPEKALKALHPLKIGYDYAAGIAENIGNHKDFIPTLVENPVSIHCRRPIGAFSQDSTLDSGCVPAMNDAAYRGGDQNVTA